MTPIHFLIEWAVRSSILILGGWLLVWLLRVKSPLNRQMAWTVLLAGSIAIPVLTAVLPRVQFDVGPAPAWTAVTVLETAPSGDEKRLPAPAMAEWISSPRPVTRPDWLGLAAILYVLAAGVLVLRLFAGLILSDRIRRRSRPAGMFADGSEVRESGEIVSPVTIGVVSPAIVLPMDWRDWNPATLNAVLAHEGSHIRRRDPVVQFFSAAHRALLWANPLSWYLHRSIVRTAEELSDDDGIQATRDRVSYAEILLEFMQRSVELRGSPGIPMARYDRPEMRIRRILNSSRVFRRPARWTAGAILAAGAPLAYFAAVAYPQSPPPPAAPKPAVAAEEKRPSFEVASIRLEPPPSVPADRSKPIIIRVGLQAMPGGGLRISNMTLREMIAYAYKLDCHDRCREFISGGPDWLDSSRYSIQARGAPSGENPDQLTEEQRRTSNQQLVRLRLQSLLADRFQLVFRTETKAGDTYVLRIARSGHKLKPGNGQGRHMIWGGDNRLTGEDATIEELAVDLKNILGRPVEDKTGLTGKYNFKLEWTPIRGGGDGPEAAGLPDSAPPIFAAVQSQLGLRLERLKGPVTKLVVVQAERPSEN